MMKRIIALFLALIMTVGLLPTVALAAEGGETPTTGAGDVKNGYYEGTTWKEGTLNQGTLPTGVESVSKTAKPTSNSNEYEVELKVVLKQTESQEKPGAAATVLVLDHSGSMNGCADCNSGKKWGGNYIHEDGCKHKGKVTTTQTRMYAATQAVKSFIKTYSGRFDENGNETTTADLNLGRWVCLVWFNKKGGVTGGGDWVDVSNKSGYQTATNTSGWKAHDGTNLDCGLRLADHWLKQSPVASINKSLKNVIVLSDGEPTYYLTDEAGWFGLEKKDITIGNKDYYVRGDGGSCDEETYNTTKSTAATLRNSASVYTVCFGVADNYMDYGDITIGNYLKYKIATPAKAGTEEKFAYDASNANELNTAFAAITHTIVSGLNTGTVKDSLPTGIKVSEADKQKFGTGTWELNSKAFNKTEETKQLADGTKETVYTYTKTYTVTIDPDDENLVKTEDGYAPLNGKTTLTVKNSQGKDVEIPFPIPAGKVTMPSYTVTFKDGANEAVFKDETQQVEYGKPIPSHADPVRPGYNFTGWTSEPANYQPGTGTMPANNITFTAQWTEKTSVTISYVAKEGGSVNKVSETLNPDTGEATGSTAAASTGYTFDGWYSDSECTEAKKVGGQATFIPIKPTTGWVDGTTFYAKFTKNTYTVTYTDGVDGAEVFADDEHNNVAYGDTIPVFTNGTPTREGYNFIGWTSSVEGVTPSSAMPASNVTFTAQWKEKDKVTINYVAKTGGSVTLANETLNPDTGVAVGSTATASTGYRFVGWYDNSECTGTALSKDASYTPSKPEAGWADKTYYAKFESLTYTITFKTENGGTINDQTNDITHPGLTAGTTFPAVPTTKANTGYYFLGWYDESGNKVEENAFPEKVTGNATYTAKWLSYKSVNLDLTGKIQKTLNSDVALTNEIFTINLTLNGAEVPSATATATVSATTASGTGYTGSAPFQKDDFKLTFTAPGTYIYSIVEEAPTRSGMTYDVNKYNATGHTMTVVVEEDAAHALSVTRVTVDGTADTDATWLTITNEYKTPSTGSVEKKTVRDSMTYGPSQTISDDILSQLYAKRMDVPSDDLKLVVDKNTNEVTLAYEVSIVGDATATAEVEDDGAEYVTYDSTVDGVNVNYNENTKIATVTFTKAATAKLYYVKTFTRENGEFATAKNFVTVNEGEPVPSDETTITDKDPGSFDFSEIIRKELKLTGSKSFTGAEFEATLTLKDFKQEVLISSMPTVYAAKHVEAWPKGWSRTLVAKFDSTAVDGSTTNFLTTDGNHLFLDFPAAGTYKFELQETNKTRTNVTYDDTVYTIVVKVTTDKEHQNYDKLVVTDIGVEYVDKDGNKVTEDIYIGGEAIGKVMTFVNTVDTGKDDYYPIIIPTIINKDTGMLNKTDHFAYVIGYPDGTVHPNGQITRAEVATIFFRLLRDEVRDGAFTTSNSYSDVAYGKWYNNPISTMSALGIITGYPDGTFKPNKPITRAEFAAIAARFDETQSGKSATFSDVIGHWAAKEIGIAYYNEWIKGYPDGTFKPDQNITRAEAMTMINRVLERKPESPADLLTNMNKWTDNMDTSKWYYLDVQEATNSHGYTRKTFNYELWRQMLPDPDWSRYER